MPDKYHMKYLSEGIIDTLIERMKTDVEATILMIVKTLTRLATKSKQYELTLIEECRSKILRDGGLEIAMSFINHKNDEIKYEVYKLIYNLN